MTRLEDDLLAKIANGSGRTYPHEGKAMALELMERRAKEKLDAKLTATQPIAGGLTLNKTWP